jgi:hypothetical protein
MGFRFEMAAVRDKIDYYQEALRQLRFADLEKKAAPPEPNRSEVPNTSLYEVCTAGWGKKSRNRILRRLDSHLRLCFL